MTKSLGRPAWMSRPETDAVMDALEAAGGVGCARFVGGCVRNSLIGRRVDDVDIATWLEPDAVMAALEAAGLRAEPTGLEHGTVTAICKGRPYEITTLRRDVETDGRRATVSFTRDWAEDAARRDFRLNALYADRQGEIFDPTGEGVRDAAAGRIVFVGAPEARIREDYLRILRLFRFQAWYGREPLAADALSACAALREGMSRLAAERISRELLKLLAADDPRSAVRAMAECGVLAIVLPHGFDLERFDRLVGIETEQLFTCDPELRLAALGAVSEPAALALGRGLRLSNALQARLVGAAGMQPRLTSWMSPRELRRAIHALGQATLSDRIKLAWAASPRPAAGAQWRGLDALATTWTPPALPITGDDILKAGVPRGPLVGEVMREVEAWWIDHDFIDDKFSAIEKLKAVVQGLVY